MDRKFTLRISDLENAKLEEVKKLTNEVTDTGAIKAVIRNYVDLSNRYQKEMEKNQLLRKKSDSLKERVNAFLLAFSALKKDNM